MARRKRKNRGRDPADTGTDTGKTGAAAILFIVAVVAVVAWGALGLRKPEVKVETAVELPSYAYISARSEQAYRASMDPSIVMGDVFSKIPCYCGCVNLGHGSLKDCFLGSHGSMCDVCQYEALETYEMVNKGIPLAQIRSTIDSRYGGGRFGPGTNTPSVA
ncbi:MAG: hypothetical protein D6733_01480 [Methanobacteriota archaeon]|nr:MAG: hypothetical protein D6733_01480 [Euryarchaeota archaeon]